VDDSTKGIFIWMFHVNSCHMDSFSYAVSCSFECSKEHKRLLVSKRFCAGIIKAAFYLLQSLVRCVNCFLSPVLKNKVLTYRKVLNREIRPNLEKRQKKKKVKSAAGFDSVECTHQRWVISIASHRLHFSPFVICCWLGSHET
jgi:hypothetical protein